MLNETLLMQEIRQWSQRVLEEPNKDFNNLPACPFAKHSWNSKRVKVMHGEGGYWYDLIKIIQNFDDNYDVVVYCGTDYDEITAEELENRISILNEEAVQNDLWIMGSHPDTEIDHAATQINFEPLFDEDYYQIFVQRLGTLVKASDSIVKKGYYKNYKNNNFQQLIQRRKQKWLEVKNLK
jgi:hypothetical protein|tara:strand:+ start:899 stop:1441 length:543 start_codon:yes stop_codon:yes gene_type:complete